MDIENWHIWDYFSIFGIISQNVNHKDNNIRKILGSHGTDTMWCANKVNEQMYLNTGTEYSSGVWTNCKCTMRVPIVGIAPKPRHKITDKQQLLSALSLCW